LFHRVPGGRFLLDQDATAALGPELLDPEPATTHESLTVKAAADGTVFGLLVSPGQPTATVSVPAVGRAPVAVAPALRHGVLAGGSWQERTAPVPPAYVPEPNDALTLRAADVAGPDEGYGAVALARTSSTPAPALVGRFDGAAWTYLATTGSDAL